MNRIFCLTLTLSFVACFSSSAQDSTAKSPQETARAYTRQGDYANAVVVLSVALQKDPHNLEFSKDLAFNYYLQQENAKGMNIARALTERPDADVQSYQILALF